MEIAFIKTATNSVRFNAKVSPTYFPNLKKCADEHFKCKINEYCKFGRFMDDIEQDLANLEEDLEKCVNNSSEELEHYNILSSFHNELSNTSDCNYNEDVIIVRYIDKM